MKSLENFAKSCSRTNRQTPGRRRRFHITSLAEVTNLRAVTFTTPLLI